MRKHYHGSIGEFDYDDKVYQYNKSTGLFEYIGHKNNIDINTVIIPEGIRVCKHLFSYRNDLIKTPHIPDSVIDATNMFSGCSNLTTVTNFPSNLKLAAYMFYECIHLKNIPKYLPNDILYADSMFENTSITETPLMDKVRCAANMFAKCNCLIKVNPIADNILNAEGMFSYCKILVKFSVEFPSQVENVSYMFNYCVNLQVVEIKEFPQSVKNCCSMFYKCVSLCNVPKMLPPNINDASEMFYGCSNLKHYLFPFRKQIGVNSRDMYYGCNNIFSPYCVKNQNGKKAKIIESYRDTTALSEVNRNVKHIVALDYFKSKFVARNVLEERFKKDLLCNLVKN